MLAASARQQIAIKRVVVRTYVPVALRRRDDGSLTGQTSSLDTPQRSSGGAVTGSVALTLRLEGALVVIGTVPAYRSFGAGWLLFAGSRARYQHGGLLVRASGRFGGL